jgi:hypothetical protein
MVLTSNIILNLANFNILDKDISENTIWIRKYTDHGPDMDSYGSYANRSESRIRQSRYDTDIYNFFHAHLGKCL